MTVKELIEQLKELPPDLLVLVSEDEEGNGFKPLSELDDSCRCEKDGRSYDLIHPDDQDEEPRGEPCVVLWP